MFLFIQLFHKKLSKGLKFPWKATLHSFSTLSRGIAEYTQYTPPVYSVYCRIHSLYTLEYILIYYTQLTIYMFIQSKLYILYILAFINLLVCIYIVYIMYIVYIYTKYTQYTCLYSQNCIYCIFSLLSTCQCVYSVYCVGLYSV